MTKFLPQVRALTYGRSDAITKGIGRSLAVTVLAGVLGLPLASQAGELGLNRQFNRPGNLLIADQFNNRVIRVNRAGSIVMSYGLPLTGMTLPGTGDAILSNVGYDLHTVQNGLYSPYDAKVVGDYTGLTPPFDFDNDADN